MIDLCRTCAKSSAVVSVFDMVPGVVGVDYAGVITKFLSLNIVEWDRLPVRICGTCADKLAAFEVFAGGVALAQELLTQQLSDQHGACQDDPVPDCPISSDDDVPLSAKISKKRSRTKKSSDNVTSENIPEARLQNPKNSKLAQCLICFKRVRALDKHLIVHSLNKQGRFHCPLCAQPSQGVQMFAVHMSSHLCADIVQPQPNHTSELPSLNCHICQNECSTAHEYLEHISHHFNIMDKPDKMHCVLCGKKVKKLNLGRHLQLHKDGIKFVCPSCGKQYAQECGLNRHIRDDHKGQRKHKCPVCLLVLTNHESLRKHQLTHPHPKPFQCDLCGETFLAQKQLYHHCKYHHTENGLRVSCDHCDKVFSSASVLRRHEKTVHLRLKEFQCEVCSVQLSTKQYLMEHLRTHADDRPEVCDKCGKTFRMRGNLRQHMKTHGERRHVCHVCGRRFARRCHLAIHISSHKDTTPLL